MPHEYQCPHCGSLLGAPRDVTGQHVRCLACQVVFVAGSPSVPAVAPAAPEPPPLPPLSSRPNRVRARRESAEERWEELDYGERPGPSKSAGPAVALVIGGAVLLVLVVAGLGAAYLFTGQSATTIRTTVVKTAPDPLVDAEMGPAPRVVGDGRGPVAPPDPKELADEVRAARHALLNDGSTFDFVQKRGPARFAAWMAAAETGSPGAQWLVGRCLDEAAGVEQDEAAALRWYRKSADQGFDLGQNSVGYCLEYGIGTDEDEDEAIRWYARAADQGLPQAMVNLGSLLLDRDTPEDDKKAVVWFRKAAEHGSVNGEFFLGSVHEDGRGVKEDLKEAVKWYAKASDRGHGDATVRLVVLFEEKGPVHDPAAAVRMRKRAEDLLGPDAGDEVLGYALANRPVGVTAPPAEGTADGLPFKLADFKGKVVVLKFGADWCPPCRAMIPHKKEMVKRLKDEPFAYLDVDIDLNETLAGRWHVDGVPVVYVIDAAGVIRDHDVRGKELDRAVDTLLKELKAKK